MPLESGYRLTIRGFVPVDPNDLDAHARAIAAVQAAKAGDLGALKDVLTIEEMKVEPVSRRVKAEDEPASLPQPQKDDRG